jgi:hypothetical protein
MHRRFAVEIRQLILHSWVLYHGLALVKLGPHLALRWQRNQIFYQCRPREKLVLNVRQLVAIVLLAGVELALYIDCIFARLQKAETAVEDVGVEHLRDDSVDEPQDFIDVILVAIAVIPIDQKRFVVHFENHFYLHPDAKD